MQVERLLLLKTYRATTAVINHQFIWMLRKGRKIGQLTKYSLAPRYCNVRQP